MSQVERIVVVGGVAGGASAAARARRMNAKAEITILEKGPVISFANCGLPYHLGGEIAERSKLLVATPELFWKRFRIGVKTGHEVTSIDRNGKSVAGKDSEGNPFQYAYDRLILATGAEPIKPPFWKEASNLLHLWTLDDMDRILKGIDANEVRNVVVIGAGFVGLEVVEQLHHRGLKIILIERMDQVLPPLDLLFARMIEEELREKDVELYLSAAVQELHVENGKVTAVEMIGRGTVPADLVIVGAGVRPRTALASQAGLTLGSQGGVKVNDFMQTDDPNIYAVGDMIEYQHGVTGEATRIPLAGPANRAGRIAGAHAACGKAEPMGKVIGTAIVRVFQQTIACTGLNLRTLKAKGIDHRAVIVQAANHAGYYPGAQSMQLMLTYAPSDGRILGAQAVGGNGVDKRIDIIATAINFGGTVYQLAQLDLAYAPPFGSAKDVVHMAAFAACNDLQGCPEVVPPDADLSGLQVLDVRTEKEKKELPLLGAVGIPVDELISRYVELDSTRPTVVVCHSGKRAHVAACWLQGQGFASVKNLTGGMSVRSLLCDEST